MEDFVDMSMLMRPVCGVYLLLLKGVVVYVGRSINVPARIAEHMTRMANTDRFRFDQIMVRSCPRAELSTLEYKYISHHKPIHNRQNLGVPAELAHIKVDLRALGIVIPERVIRRT